jgi:glycosyltransferase involved in cell wall biosynthesis
VRELTIGFSTYGQPRMLAFWFEKFLAQPQEWRDRVEVIVVDDAGTPPAEVPQQEGIRLARVKKNIPWNQPGARNLIAHLAATKRLMLIDPDMTLDDGMLQKLVEESRHLNPGLMFRPALRHIATSEFDHTSPNVHLILLEDFRKLGGYDEDYCGAKGWSDVQLLRTMQKAMVTRTREDLWFWFHHGNRKVPDAQVTSLDRSVKRNKAIHLLKMTKLKKLGWQQFVAKCVGQPLRFEWEILR